MTQKLLELHCRPKQTLTHPRGVAEKEEDHAIFFPIESVAAVVCKGSSSWGGIRTEACLSSRNSGGLTLSPPIPLRRCLAAVAARG